MSRSVLLVLRTHALATPGTGWMFAFAQQIRQMATLSSRISPARAAVRPEGGRLVPSLATRARDTASLLSLTVLLTIANGPALADGDDGLAPAAAAVVSFAERATRRGLLKPGVIAEIIAAYQSTGALVSPLDWPATHRDAPARPISETLARLLKTSASDAEAVIAGLVALQDRLAAAEHDKADARARAAHTHRFDWLAVAPGQFVLHFGGWQHTGTMQLPIEIDRPFEILAHPVTQAAFAERLGFNPSRHVHGPTSEVGRYRVRCAVDMPVDSIDQHLALTLCATLDAENPDYLHLPPSIAEYWLATLNSGQIDMRGLLDNDWRPSPDLSPHPVKQLPSLPLGTGQLWSHLNNVRLLTRDDLVHRAEFWVLKEGALVEASANKPARLLNPVLGSADRGAEVLSWPKKRGERPGTHTVEPAALLSRLSTKSLAQRNPEAEWGSRDGEHSLVAAKWRTVEPTAPPSDTVGMTIVRFPRATEQQDRTATASSTAGVARDHVLTDRILETLLAHESPLSQLELAADLAAGEPLAPLLRGKQINRDSESARTPSPRTYDGVIARINRSRAAVDLPRLIRQLEQDTDQKLGLRPPVPALEASAIEFIAVAAGAFDLRRPDRSSHGVAVTLTEDFELATHPITEGQWAAVMPGRRAPDPGRIDHPVDGRDWREAQWFCQRLTAADDGWVYGLPSLAEWQYAARDLGRHSPSAAWRRFLRKVNPAAGLANGQRLALRPVKSDAPMLIGRQKVWSLVANVQTWLADDARRERDYQDTLTGGRIEEGRLIDPIFGLADIGIEGVSPSFAPEHLAGARLRPSARLVAGKGACEFDAGTAPRSNPFESCDSRLLAYPCGEPLEGGVGLHIIRVRDGTRRARFIRDQWTELRWLPRLERRLAR